MQVGVAVSMRPSPSFQATAKDLVFEVLAVTTLVVGYTFILRDIQGFNFWVGEKWRLAPTAIAFAPALLVYALLRLALAPLVSSLLSTSLLYLLSEASRVKLALTNDPVGWADISSLANASVITHYITKRHLLLVALGIAVIVVLTRIAPAQRRSWRQTAVALSAVVLLVPATLHPYVDGTEFHRKAGLRYIAWDWPQNVRMNSLPIHIVQTSKRTMPKAASTDEARLFGELRSASAAPSAKRPSNVTVVLCEACWHDQTHFRDSFSKLRERGFRELRSIAPTYGGGTVNSTFEVLTGLPAGGQLRGVVYQEYASELSDSVPALPRALREAGYSTFAAHNHSKGFWKRDVVNPKLGFEKFLGLEDLDYTGPIWADDSVLFEAALREFGEADGPTFAYLTTVYTHGGYKFDNDFGEGDFQRRLEKTMRELAAFVDSLLKRNPDALIVVYADHKPALTKYLFEAGVFSRDDFSAVGETSEDFRFSDRVSLALRGDVPVYVYHRDRAKVASFIKAADSKPFYCLSMYLNREFLNVPVPAHEFSARNRVCDEFRADDYRGSVARYPAWLYSSTLF